MMRRGGETPEEEKARFKESRRFCKHVAELLGGQPDIVFEHVGQATFPTSVLAVKPFGKVVICGATSGYQLDFDVRYLWMRQKQIIGSHFANAWECNKANELIEQGKIRPVLWRTLGFDGVAEAHQLLRDNKHLGKIAILVGRRGRGPGQDRRGPRRDPGGGGCLMAGRRSHPLVRDGVPRRRLRGGAGARSRRSRCATARPTARSTARATTATSSSRSPRSRTKRDCERYWNGPGVPVDWRADYSSWYQVPVLYVCRRRSCSHGAARHGRQRRTA